MTKHIFMPYSLLEFSTHTHQKSFAPSVSQVRKETDILWCRLMFRGVDLCFVV